MTVRTAVPRLAYGRCSARKTVGGYRYGCDLPKGHPEQHYTIRGGFSWCAKVEDRP